MILALIVVLAVSAVLDLALGAWAGASWESFGQIWFVNPARVAGPEPQLLGLVLGLALIFFAALQLDAIRGIRTEREGAYRVPVFFGGYLIVSSVVTFLAIQTRNSEIMTLKGAEFLLVDGLRGAFLVVLGVVAMKAPPTVRELRLPKQGAAQSGDDDFRSRDRRPDRDRGRGGRNRSDRGGPRRHQGGRAARGSQRSSASADAPRVTKPEPGSKDRSLSVVVKGGFRSDSDRKSSSGDDARSNADRPEGRRRRRRGGNGGRSQESSESKGESFGGPALANDVIGSSNHRAANPARVIAPGANGDGPRRELPETRVESKASLSAPAASVTGPARATASDFGRSPRPETGRRR